MEEEPSRSTTRFAWAAAKGALVAAYGTDCRVVIASGPSLCLLQVLGPFESAVSAVELRHETLTLAIAVGPAVHVFEVAPALDDGASTLSWCARTVFDAPCGTGDPVLGLAWAAAAPRAGGGALELWAVGSTLALCAVGASAPAWRAQLEEASVLVSASPDGWLLATCAAGSCAARCWFGAWARRPARSRAWSCASSHPSRPSPGARSARTPAPSARATRC
jgi:hypothetical protein